MTLSTQNRIEIYRGNSSAVVWPWHFRIDYPEELIVALQDFATGEILEVLVPGSYSALGFGEDAGGDVTYPLSGDPLPASKNIVLMRTVPYTQDLDIQPYGGFNPDTVMRQLDRIVMQIQQLAEAQGRALVVEPGQTPPNITELIDDIQDAIAAADRAEAAADSIDGLTPKFWPRQMIAEGDYTNLVNDADVANLSKSWIVEGTGTASQYRGPEGRGVLLTKPLGFTTQSSIRNGDWFSFNENSFPSAVKPGEKLFLMCDVTRKAGALGGNAGLFLRMLKRDGTTTSTSLVTAATPIGVTVPLYAEYIVPEDVLFFQTQVYYGNNVASAGGSIAITNFGVYRAGEERLSRSGKARLGSRFQRGDLVQKRVCDLFYGFNNGTTDTQIYSGAASAVQAFCLATVDGVKKIFALQRPTGASSNHKTTERQRLAMFPYRTDGGVATHEVFTNELALGHGEFLYPIQSGADLYFLTTNTTQVGREDGDSGKGIQRILWAGAATVAGTQFQLLPYSDVVTDPLSEFGKGAFGVSSDGKTLFARVASTKDNGLYLMGWNLADVLATGGGAVYNTVRPIFGPFRTVSPAGDENAAMQGVISDGEFIYASLGFAAALGRHSVQTYNMSGLLVADRTVPGVAADYGLSGLLNHSTLGIPIQHEFEGIAFGETDEEILVCELDTWINATGTSIVTYRGANWACLVPGTTDPPYVQGSWCRTLKPANAGAWDVANAGTYTIGNFTKRTKSIYRISAPKGEAGEKPTGDNSLFYRGPGCDVISAGNPDIVYRGGQTWQMKAWFQALVGEYFDALSYNGEYLNVFNVMGDVSFGAFVRNVATGGRAYASFGNSTGGAINFYHATDSVHPNRAAFFNGNSIAVFWDSGAVPAWYPGVNAAPLGKTGNRWGASYINSVITAVRRITAAGAIAVTATDSVVVVAKTTGAASAVTLPASPEAGQTVTIKDGKGDAATNNITISPAAGNIDGAATKVINANYGSVQLVYDGTQWLSI